jgi:multimeric flavodoxin WrbA
MKILAINSSHRGDKGLTRFFIDKIFDGASTSKAECEVITLAKYKINRCLSCYQCQTQEYHLQCVYNEKDDVQTIFDKMSEADIIIFATPIYLMNMTGLLKIFLDRLYGTMDIHDARLSNGLIHHHINPLISSKPFVTLVVCGNLENESLKSVVSYFQTYAKFMESKQVGVLVRNASSLFDTTNNPKVAINFPKIFEVCSSFEKAGSELATLGYIRRSTQRKASQEVIRVPFFSILKKFRPIKEKVVEYLRESSIQPPPTNL